MHCDGPWWAGASEPPGLPHMRSYYRTPVTYLRHTPDPLAHRYPRFGARRLQKGSAKCSIKSSSVAACARTRAQVLLRPDFLGLLDSAVHVSITLTHLLHADSTLKSVLLCDYGSRRTWPGAASCSSPTPPGIFLGPPRPSHTVHGPSQP